MEKIKVLIADDHPVMRSGIKSVLLNDPQIEVAGEAADGLEAFSLIEKNNYDVALIDMKMPEMSGLEILRRISKTQNNVRFVFLTMYKDEDLFNEAMDAGAMGYVLKENAVEDVLESVKAAAGGNYYISPLISGYLVSRLNRRNSAESKKPSINDLTATERIVLKLVSEEKTSQQIAGHLFISYKTVENHRNNISKKLGLSGTHSLVKFAITNKDIL